MTFERGVLFIAADCISDDDDDKHVTHLFALSLFSWPNIQRFTFPTRIEYWTAFLVPYLDTIDVPRITASTPNRSSSTLPVEDPNKTLAKT